MKYSIKYLKLSIILLLFVSCSQNNMVELKDENGAVVERFQVTKDSTRHGEFSAYYPDGSPKETALYSQGKLNGERKIFYPNGQVEIHERYEMDVMEGPYKVFHDNGNLKLVVNFYGGVMEGPLKAFYSDGVLKEELKMEDNNENGPFKEYYSNGNIHWEGNYLNGDNEFGELKEYNEDGVLIRIMECDSLAICKTTWKKEE